VQTLSDGITSAEQLAVPEIRNCIAPFETEADLNHALAAEKKAPPSKENVAAIVKRNAFGERVAPVRQDDIFAPVDRSDESNYVNSTTLYLLTSFINHSCVSNVTVVQLPSSGAHFIRAATELQPGDELFIQYKSVMVPRSDRNKSLRTWGFVCKCPRCLIEEQLPKEVTDLLNKLAQDANYSKEPEGSIGEMRLKLDKSNECEKETLLHIICARVAELEKALLSTGLPSTQLDWVRASVFSAYRIMKAASDSKAGAKEYLRVAARNLEIEQAVSPGDEGVAMEVAILAFKDAPKVEMWADNGEVPRSSVCITTVAAKKLMRDCIRSRYGRELTDSEAEQLGERIYKNVCNLFM
jgi:hypothetical protein